MQINDDYSAISQGFLTSKLLYEMRVEDNRDGLVGKIYDWRPESPFISKFCGFPC